MLGIYTRLSVQDDASNSIENQKREGVAFAKKNNLSFKIYNEGQGVSGRDEISDRPQLDQLLKDIASTEITHVWFRNQNRLERNSNTFHLFANQVKKSNVKVYFDNKLEDWEDPSSFLKSSILTSLNEYQASLQSYQTKKALLDNVKEGKSFGVYPYGYKSDENGYLVVDEEEKEIVELIYELSLSGKGTRSIAEYLNNKKIPTRYNKIGKGTLTVKNRYTKIETVINKKMIKWSGNSIRGIIINTIYKGDRKWKGKTFKTPPIFEPAYWKKVNENLKNNRNNTGKKVEHKYLLKGILECGKCGRNMYGRTRVSKKDHYYMCSSKRYKDLNCGNRSINIDVVEDFLWRIVLSDKEIKSNRARSDEREQERRLNELLSQKDSFEKELAKIDEANKRLVKLRISGVIDEKYLEQEALNLKQREKDYIIKLDNVKEEIQFEEESKKLKKDILKDVRTNSRPDVPFNKKRELIQKYITRVKVYYDKDVQYYFLAINFKISGFKQIYPIQADVKAIRDMLEGKRPEQPEKERRVKVRERVKELTLENKQIKILE